MFPFDYKVSVLSFEFGMNNSDLCLVSAVEFGLKRFLENAKAVNQFPK